MDVNSFLFEFFSSDSFVSQESSFSSVLLLQFMSAVSMPIILNLNLNLTFFEQKIILNL